VELEVETNQRTLGGDHLTRQILARLPHLKNSQVGTEQPHGAAVCAHHRLTGAGQGSQKRPGSGQQPGRATWEPGQAKQFPSAIPPHDFLQPNGDNRVAT
jgi:hypothetical protein